MITENHRSIYSQDYTTQGKTSDTLVSFPFLFGNSAVYKSKPKKLIGNEIIEKMS